MISDHRATLNEPPFPSSRGDWAQLSDDDAAEAVLSEASRSRSRREDVTLAMYLRLVPNLSSRRVVLDAAIEAVLTNADVLGRDRCAVARSLSRDYPEFSGAVADVLYLDSALGTTAQCRSFVRASPPPVPFGVGPPLADGLPRYQALARVGEGTSGAVYSAEDRLFASRDRPALVALKVLFEVDHASASFVVAEAIRNRRIEHPNVVRALDAGATPWGAPFIVSEFIDGRDLSAGDDKEGRRDLRDIVRIVIEAAKGVEAAHAAGVIHLDLKPSNVMIGKDGTVRVTDFGLARAVDPEHGDPSAPTFVGSLGFAPPEHLDGIATTSSDVYGLGGLLYYLITHNAPNGATPDEARRWITGDEADSAPPGASASLLRKAGADKDLAAVCLMALSRLPADRHPTAAALRADLEAIAELRPIPSIQQGLIRRAGLWVRRRPLVAACSAALCVALASGVATWIRAVQVARVGERQTEAARMSTSLLEFAAKHKGTDLDRDGLQIL